MNNTNNNKTRNVTARDILATIVILALMVPVFWYKEMGKEWATLVVAAIPIIGLIYWLRIPSKRRDEAEKLASEEMKASALGRGWIYFTWLIYAFCAYVLIKMFIEWVKGA